ncbi:hypothetical protein KY284_020141 [Solanum tuberosum]|nr:hypothetical protein KY284_020141 [Solanum tuberosum]
MMTKENHSLRFILTSFLVPFNYTITKTLSCKEYEKQSGQMMNKEKSFYYLHQNIDTGIPPQVEQITRMVRRNIGNFLSEEGWDFEALEENVLEYVVDHIRLNMSHVKLIDQGDKPWWTKTRSGKFTVKSAWDLLRQKENSNDDLKLLWVKGIPFKFSFLAWRIWRGKIHVGKMMHAWNPLISQFCKCCSIPEVESLEHLFLKGEIATGIWNLESLCQSNWYFRHNAKFETMYKKMVGDKWKF